MFQRYTDRARKVLALANQEAQRFNHEYVGEEHILLGLIKEGSGVASHVIQEMGLTLPSLRLSVEKIVKSGPEMVTMGRLPYSPGARRALESAQRESSKLNHNYIGTEHLLLGLLAYQNVVQAIFKDNSVCDEDVRNKVIEILGVGKNKAANKSGHEYCVIRSLRTESVLSPLLNEYASEGWEPISFMPDNDFIQIIFRREREKA